jgi:SAM-dependent methyltransferase
MTEASEIVHPLLARFHARFAADRRLHEVPDWMVGWLYKDQTSWIDFDAYRGGADLAAIFRWASWKPPSCFLSGEPFTTHLDASIAYDRGVLSALGVEVDEAALRDTAILNAMDLAFSQACLVPERLLPKRVLDFGAGQGRQYNLLHRYSAMTHYVAMDATPMLACAQRDYLGGSGAQVSDYFADGRIELDAPIVLLPTWRHDLLPDASLDLVMAVEVLPELPEAMLPWTVAMFARKLRPGGALYLRDPELALSRNRVPVAPLLEAAGFALEFRPQWMGDQDCPGVPRVWRRLGPEASA